MYYPVFLDLAGTRCLVAGAGSVGLRKLGRLLECGAAEILVLDACAPSPELKEKLEDKRVTFAQRPFADGDLDGRGLVFAATSCRETNARIAALCAARGILCNCADDPGAGSFIVPAVAGHGRLTAAISTGGASPAQARMLKEELNEWLTGHAALTGLMGRIRPLVLDLEKDSGHNSILFRKLASSGLREALAAGDADKCRALLREILPRALHGRIEELMSACD